MRWNKYTKGQLIRVIKIYSAGDLFSTKKNSFFNSALARWTIIMAQFFFEVLLHIRCTVPFGLVNTCPKEKLKTEFRKDWTKGDLISKE